MISYLFNKQTLHVEGLFVEQIAFYKSTNAKILLNICSNSPKCGQTCTHGTGTSMNNESIIMMAAIETEALLGAEKLVATTSRRQTGTHNNQL